VAIPLRGLDMKRVGAVLAVSYYVMCVALFVAYGIYERPKTTALLAAMLVMFAVIWWKPQQR
jgi:hypothetical protein